ncbi:MAG TPA: BRCT domain-containing protein, partial [Polyangiaceae bacterium]|nr:BRCT domain-containing protein [Polyangiaceae bacterium]
MSLDVRDKTVVLTGTFSKLKRAEAETKLAALGAKIGGSVGKSTHILFAGEKAGSKIDAAGRLGITVLGEDELMALLAGKSKQPAKARAASSAFAALDSKAPGPSLAAAIEALPWDDFEADRDLLALREVLYAHEAAHGITAAHRAATARLRPHATLGHAHGHDVEVGECELSPDGRFLATGSWVGDDYDRGGVLQIWDVRAGRCVNMFRVRGGVGWPDYGGCIQWRPDGKRVGLAFDTNGVGSFDPFGKSGEPDSCAYVTDGWSRPPSWGWSSNNRDVYIACWGPNLALGAIVPLVGRRPQPRWCESVGRANSDDPNSEPRLQPMSGLDWSRPERIVGHSGRSQLFALDA